MTGADLRSEILRLGPWHHDVEVAPGIRTGDPVPPGTYPAELGTPAVSKPDLWIAELVKDLFGDGFGGRSVVDCGCNAGGHLFAAAKRGAGRCYGFDVREHWIHQARFLARHLPGDDIAFGIHEIDAMRAMNPEPFDVAFFFGVFYHLPDPVASLRVIADLTRELLILNTAFIRKRGVDALLLNSESRTRVMSGVHGLAWMPTGDRVLREILAWCGFPHSRLRTIVDWPGHASRLEIVAARDERSLAHYDRVRGPAPIRVAPTLMQRLFRKTR